MDKLSREKQEEMIKNLPGWEIKEDPERIMKEIKLDDFKSSMDLVQKVAKLAEENNHHPDIYISYDIVVLELTSHDVGGLTEADFSMAEKINEL